MDEQLEKAKQFEALSLEEMMIIDGGKTKSIIDNVVEGIHAIYNYFH